MSRRLPLAVSLVLTSAALSAVALADPVTQSRIAATSFVLTAAHDVQVKVALELTQAGSVLRLRVRTESCDGQGCDAPQDWSGPVTGSEVSATQARAHLTAHLGGAPVAITWEPTNQTGVVIHTLDASGGDSGDQVSTYHGDPADARITLGGHTCLASGDVGDAVRVSDSPNDGAAPLSEFTLPPGSMTC